MYAVATLLYDPKYLPGALVLGHTLRKINAAKTRLIVLIDKTAFEDWQLALLLEVWDDLVNTHVSESSLHQKLYHDLKRPELAKTYTKIELWNLPYEKVLYLDADVLPLQSPNLVTDLLKLDFPAGKILAAPDSGFPDIFNSGVFVLKPNSRDYVRLVHLVRSNASNISFDGADQGLLNQYFNPDPDWVSGVLNSGNSSVDARLHVQTSNWIPIPFLYNTTPNTQYQYSPASNHFGYPGESSGIGPSGSSLLRSQSGPEAPAYSQESKVSPYGNIALEHFLNPRRKSQVSVLHFIGASKPWNDESAPVFKEWWSQWYEYSQGKSLDVVLSPQNRPISINPLRVPSGASDGVNLKQVKTPAELCDPENYQHVKSQVASNTLSWDATRETPPREVPETSRFDLGKKSFQNDWDDYKQQEQAHKEHALKSSDMSRIFETPSHYNQEEFRGEHKTQHNHEKPIEFGVHDEQVPERVFDESSDYTPHHLLMMTDRHSLVSGDVTPANGPTYRGASSDIEGSFSKISMEVNGTIEKKNRSDSKEGSFVDSESERGVPKIFPWEHRDHRPERVWE